MNRRDVLLRAVQKYDFALYDLMLYLDTHPNCREALMLYRKYRKERANAVEEYTRKYGPIEALQSKAEHKWDWGQGPYPWEREAN
ncbi:MAG: spore coat protein CotJB [Clostridia bacterium]|nr:spore coat protein CotJB [Clostridia bacterium]